MSSHAGADPGWLCAGLLACAACGRLGFGSVDAGGDAGPEVVVDLSGDFTYVPDDFVDQGNSHDNALVGLCMLAPPFSSSLAVLGPRALYEVTPASTIVVHDYRPAMSGLGGPDAFRECLMSASPTDGTVLWLGGASIGGGDGLYNITSAWDLTRANTLNNVEGMLVDDGTHGVPGELIYSSDGQLYARPADVSVATIGLRVPTLARTGDGGVVGVVEPVELTSYAVSTFDRVTFAHTELFVVYTEPAFALEARPEAPVIAYAIFDHRALVILYDDGMMVPIAAPDDPDSLWVDVAVPPANNSLPRALYVLESNRVLDRDRVLRIPVP